MAELDSHSDFDSYESFSHLHSLRSLPFFEVNNTDRLCGLGFNNVAYGMGDLSLDFESHSFDHTFTKPSNGESDLPIAPTTTLRDHPDSTSYFSSLMGQNSPPRPSLPRYGHYPHDSAGSIPPALTPSSSYASSIGSLADLIRQQEFGFAGQVPSKLQVDVGLPLTAINADFGSAPPGTHPSSSTSNNTFAYRRTVWLGEIHSPTNSNSPAPSPMALSTPVTPLSPSTPFRREFVFPPHRPVELTAGQEALEESSPAVEADALPSENSATPAQGSGHKKRRSEDDGRAAHLKKFSITSVTNPSPSPEAESSTPNSPMILSNTETEVQCWCGKNYNRRSELARHDRETHLNPTNFTCWCGSNYTRDTSLRRHQKIKHRHSSSSSASNF